MNLKPLVNDTNLYKSFLEYLDKDLEEFRKYLELCDDYGQMRELQGSIKYIRKLKTLKERVNGQQGQGTS